MCVWCVYICMCAIVLYYIYYVLCFMVYCRSTWDDPSLFRADVMLGLVENVWILCGISTRCLENVHLLMSFPEISPLIEGISQCHVWLPGRLSARWRKLRPVKERPDRCSKRENAWKPLAMESCFACSFIRPLCLVVKWPIKWLLKSPPGGASPVVNPSHYTPDKATELT